MRFFKDHIQTIPTKTIEAKPDLLICFMVCKKQKTSVRVFLIGFLAEKVGFEPTVMLPPRLISSQVHSATLPLLLHSTLRLLTAANSNSAC